MNDKRYQLQYLPTFYEDLEKTAQYLITQIGSPQAAAALIDDVESAILERLPFAESFEVYPSAKQREYPYYTIYVKNYIVFYVVIDHRIMEVRRLLYKGRNIRSII